MKKRGELCLKSGLASLLLFVLWTVLVYTVDVQPAGVNGTEIGFAEINVWFHSVIGVNMYLYALTDWLGLVPVSICFGFGVEGLVQLFKRKSLLKVDRDIIISGIYYIAVFAYYFLFEMIPINYRPVLIDGCMEPSYPSSTTLLVLSVMPTLVMRSKIKLESSRIKKLIICITMLFGVLMLIGRLLSGVHWITDIIGSAFLSAGLFCVYKSSVLLCDKN